MGGEGENPLPPLEAKPLLERVQSRRAKNASRRWGRPSGVKPDHTSRVRAEAALPGSSDAHGISNRHITVRIASRATSRNRGDGNRALGNVEVIAALERRIRRAALTRQRRGNQERSRASRGRNAGSAAQHTEGRGESIAIGRAERNCSGVNGTERADR